MSATRCPVAAVRCALDEQRFVLHAQPIVDLMSRRAVQHELLVRLVDHAGRVLPPRDFLPAAERSGLIVEIDRWVISQAAQIAADGLRVAVNLSALSLAERDFGIFVEEQLAASGASPRDLVFEVTETAAIADLESARKVLERIVALGSEVALDDFGTGCTSFAYLKRLPVTYVKIAGDFVRGMRSSTADRAIVSAIVQVADGLGLETTGEGVEDAATETLLWAHGVDLAQGFHLGRPAPIEMPSRVAA